METTLARRLGRVLIVGGGRMGQAICAGLMRVEGMEPSSVTVANPGEQKRRAVEEAHGVKTVQTAVEGLPADTIVLAVKPAKVFDVACELSQAGIGQARVFSIAAGVSTSKLARALGQGVPVVRIMPNTPLLVGAGMSAVSGGVDTSHEDVQLALELFASLGSAVVVDESKQDIVTALSGSGPAYFELVAEAMAREGERLGLDYNTSLELVLETMRGTAVMLEETGQDLREAIAAVSSPGGTTIAALNAFGDGNLEQTVALGVSAACARSKELGE